MASAPTLLIAAETAPQNMQVQWLAGTLRTAILAFAADCESSFSDANANDRPVGNWLAVIAASATGLTTTAAAYAIPADAFSLQAKQIYSICLLAFQLRAASLISAAQATVMLASYNARFG